MSRKGGEEEERQSIDSIHSLKIPDVCVFQRMIFVVVAVLRGVKGKTRQTTTLSFYQQSLHFTSLQNGISLSYRIIISISWLFVARDRLGWPS